MSNQNICPIVGRLILLCCKVREALSDYEDAIRLDAQNGQAYLYRGILHVNAKRRKSACEDFNKAKRLNVPDAEGAIQKYCKKK